MQDRLLEISHVGGLFDGACNEIDMCPPHFQNFGEIAKNYFGGKLIGKLYFIIPLGRVLKTGQLLLHTFLVKAPVFKINGTSEHVQRHLSPYPELSVYATVFRCQHHTGGRCVSPDTSADPNTPVPAGPARAQHLLCGMPLNSVGYMSDLGKGWGAKYCHPTSPYPSLLFLFPCVIILYPPPV